MEKKIETITCAPLKIAKTSAPYVEIENGQRLMQMYGTMATQKANAELIVTAVNAYSPMLEALKDGHEALSDIINAADNNQPYSADELAKLFIGAYNKIHEAIALAENKQ